MRPLVLVPILAAAWLGAGSRPARAQTEISLGFGVGTVRFAGGSSFSSVTLAPALRFAAPGFYLESNGFVSSLPDGGWAAQGRADAWMPLWAETAQVHPALAGTVAGSTRNDGARSGAAHLVGELVWRGGIAVGAGPSVGSIEGEAPVTALRLRARGWWRDGDMVYSVMAEPTRFFGEWYSDLTAGAMFERGPWAIQLWGVARVSRFYGSKGTGSFAVQWALSPVLSLEAAAGGFLSEPFQGLPRAGFVTAGVRLRPRPRPGAAAPLDASRSAGSLPPEGATPTPLPLVAARRGDSAVVRFHMPGARSLAIAGDWTGWQPRPLVAVAAEIWEAALALPAGTYHFNLVVDGHEWVVPGGVATLTDGMGGLLAILIVP
jgi:AMP-activated protein kinase-like protein